MKEKHVVGNVNNKNSFYVSNDGINLVVTLDQIVFGTFSLKSFIKNFLKGAAFIDELNMQVIIPENTRIDLNDDLLDFDIINSKIEFILHKNSSLNYMFDASAKDDMLITDDGMLISYHKKAYLEKELTFRFIGENSRAKIKCLCKGEYDRVFRLKTIQDHQVSNTKSDLIVKGAFCHKSKIFCDSLIRVEKNAKNVVAHQLNKNLLLGCESRAVSIPKLEIQSDDVKCKHGATISRLDEEQLFYLQSRGIDFCSAKNLLIDAFLN